MDESKILDKVRKLLDLANHPNTGAKERETFLEKADSMMIDHAISEAMLDAVKTPEQRRKPITREFQAWDDYVWRGKFVSMMDDIARTVGVRCVVAWSGKVNLIGMSDDVDYVELLWTNTYFAFLSKLHPRWEKSLSFEHNVYNFKLAGTKWADIRDRAREAGHWVDWPDGGRLIRAYRHHCKILGEEPTNHTQRHDAYRDSFADGFVDRISTRLFEMRNKRTEEAEKQGAGLVLVTKEEVIDEVYWTMYPQEHPDNIAKLQEQYRKDVAVRAEQEAADAAAKQAAREDLLSKMTDKQRQEFFDKEERARRREAAQNERAYREWAYANRGDSDGARAGRSAADSVDLTRKGGSVRNQNRGELG